MELKELEQRIEQAKKEVSVVERVALLALFLHQHNLFDILGAGLVDTRKDFEGEVAKSIDGAILGVKQLVLALEEMRAVMGLDEDKPEPVLPVHIN